MDNFINSELTPFNPWWIQSDLIKKDDKLIEFGSQKYKFWPKFYRRYPLNKDGIFIIRGPRRVGKTTLIKLLIKKLLLEKKLPAEAIMYSSLDRIVDFNKLFNLVKEYLDFARPRTNNRLHIFLDEATFVNQWIRAIKDLADRGLLKNSIITLTGSNVLELTASGERMPGRRGEIFKPDINFYPLHFGEFLNVVAPDLVNTRPESLWQLTRPKLEKYLQDYILTGGFIFNINKYYQKKHLPSFVYELFSSWVTGDMYKLKRSEEFTLRLVEQIPKHLTSKISLSRLARETGMASALTASEYLELLERMFILFKTPYFSLDQKRPNIKKNIKVYFQDPFMLASLVSKAEGVLDEAFQAAQSYFSSKFMPQIAEMLVGSILNRFYNKRLFYGMSKNKEIDFVVKKGKVWKYFEVKYQRNISPKDIVLPEVLKNKKITIITQNSFEKRTNLSLIPLSIFAAFPEKYCLF